MHRKVWAGVAIAVATVTICAIATAQGPNHAESFKFHRPGYLDGENEQGVADRTVRFPHIEFPIAFDPASQSIAVNSQVYGHGGYCHAAPCKGQDPAQPEDGHAGNAANFRPPWRDTFCEKGGRELRGPSHNPQCTHQTGSPHQGVDIRPPENRAGIYDAVAVEPGEITLADGHVVKLTGDDSGTEYAYRHLVNLRVAEGEKVSRGDVLGKVGNIQGWKGKDVVYTTPHLHFEAWTRQQMGEGARPYPLYASLVMAYTRKLGLGLPTTFDHKLFGSTPWEIE